MFETSYAAALARALAEGKVLYADFFSRY